MEKILSGQVNLGFIELLCELVWCCKLQNGSVMKQWKLGEKENVLQELGGISHPRLI